MLELKCFDLELRGLVNKNSNKGNVYYILYVENKDGKPFNFYCPSSSAFPNGLKKGDKINVVFELTYYKNEPKLTIKNIEKV